MNPKRILSIAAGVLAVGVAVLLPAQYGMSLGMVLVSTLSFGLSIPFFQRRPNYEGR